MDFLAYHNFRDTILGPMLKILVGAGLLLSATTAAFAQAPIEVTVGVRDTGAWGRNYPAAPGSRVQEQIFEFDYVKGNGGLLFTASVFDLDKANVQAAELSINVDGGVTTVLAPQTGNGRSRVIRIELPDSAFANGSRHRIQVFNNEGPRETWGIRNVNLKFLRGDPQTATFGRTLRGEFGYRFAGNSHPGVLPVNVNVPTKQDVKIEARGYDVNRYGEVQVYVNGRLVGYLRSGRNRAFASKTSLNVHSSDIESGTNTIEFRQRKAGARWGVKDVRMGPATSTVREVCAGTESTGNVPNQVYVRPGDDLRKVVNSSPAGSEFLITRGTYYLGGKIIPRTNDKFICEPGTKIRGSRRLNSARAVPAGGGRWLIRGAPRARPGSGFMLPGREINSIPNDIFVDGKLYLRVNRLSKVNDIDSRFDGTTMHYGTFYQDGSNIYLPMDPRRRVVEMSRVSHALQSIDASTDNGVLIERCTFERFASGNIQGTIDAGRASNWTVRGVTSRYNHGGGLMVGNNTKAYCGSYSFNGQNGISGTFDPNIDNGRIIGFKSRSSGADIRYTNMRNNNFAGNDPQQHTAALKLVATQGATVIGNKVINNLGVGIWLDFEVDNSTIRGNQVYRNASRGIQVEVSRRATVENNVVKCNSMLSAYSLGRSWYWGSNILAKNSPSVTIRNNQVSVDKGQGIAVVDNLFTGYFFGTTNFRRATNVRVSGNTISFTRRSVPGGNAQFTHQMMGLESDGSTTTGGQGALDCQAPRDFLDQGLVSQASINACNAVGGMDATAASNVISGNTYNIPRSAYTYWRKAGRTFNRVNIPVAGTFNPTAINIDNTLNDSLCK